MGRGESCDGRVLVTGCQMIKPALDAGIFLSLLELHRSFQLSFVLAIQPAIIPLILRTDCGSQ